jgi:hypothetical protein
LLVVVLALVAAPMASAAVSYPTSAGAGACSFASGASTIDTTALTITGAGSGPALVADGNYAVLNCTTLTVASGANVLVLGARGADLRASGAVVIDGVLDASAQGAVGGPGAALLVTPNGANGGGADPGSGGGGTSGGGGGGTGPTSVTGGGGGGGGFAGGGGGAAGAAGVLGGNGGGATPGTGGASESAGGHSGVGGPAGAVNGANGATNSGGGGGGGAYGSQPAFRPGSGGGGGGSDASGAGAGAGGGGGGALRIVSATSLTIGAAGMIASKGAGGAPPSQSAAGGGGGGSGGGVQLIAPSVSVASGGFILATAGIGAASGGSGGSGGKGSPGRIDITANSTSGLGANPAATVVPYSYALTVSKAGSGSGSVTSTPGGIDCGGDCAEDYDPGVVVTLSATAAGGSTFNGWSGPCSNASGDCTVTLDQARAVTATFAQQATDSGSGSGGGSDSGAGTPTTAPATSAEQNPPVPASSGTTAAKLSAIARARQPFGRTRKLVVTVACSRAGTVSVSGTLAIGRKRIKLPKLTRAAARGAKVTFTLKLSKSVGQQVTRALRSHTVVVATVTAASGATRVVRKVRAT